MRKLLLLFVLFSISCDSGGFKIENDTEYSQVDIMSMRKQLDSLAIDNLGTSTDYKSYKIQLGPSFGKAKDMGWKSIGAFYYSTGPLNFLQSFVTDKDDKVILTGVPVDADLFD